MLAGNSINNFDHLTSSVLSHYRTYSLSELVWCLKQTVFAEDTRLKNNLFCKWIVYVCIRLCLCFWGVHLPMCVHVKNRSWHWLLSSIFSAQQFLEEESHIEPGCSPIQPGRFTELEVSVIRLSLCPQYMWTFIHCLAQLFILVPEIQIQVLMIMYQALYPQSHLPIPNIIVV